MTKTKALQEGIMKNVDRALLIALVMGVWALVLKPEAPTAHSGQHCDIDSANGYGEIEELMEGGSVYVYQITGTAYCY
tara:strand:+ start:332 stop:565 length:234 start_codon:yes stop_codon:yes gene_type:complete